MRRGAVLAGMATVVALAATAVSTADATSRYACGGYRWTVKTLQDRPRLLPARKTTIHFLSTRPVQPHLPDTRLPFERHVFTLTAKVVLVQPQGDGDLHVVLQQRGDRMITEAPSPSCVTQATPSRRRQMRVARSHVRLCERARVTGVAFFDFPHGQTGAAPNAIELHPILSFTCLS